MLSNSAKDNKEYLLNRFKDYPEICATILEAYALKDKYSIARGKIDPSFKKAYFESWDKLGKVLTKYER